MKNLYDELIEILAVYGKTTKDITHVCGASFQIPVDEFLTLAKNTFYERISEQAEIAMDLKIIGQDFVVTREQDQIYIGDEYFVYEGTTDEGLPYRSISSLKGAWATTAVLNQKVEENCLKAS